MLVLSRMAGEKIVIGGNIVITVLEVRGKQVRMSFEAPRDVVIHREEVADRIADDIAFRYLPDDR